MWWEEWSYIVAENASIGYNNDGMNWWLCKIKETVENGAEYFNVDDA
jgi:hypothetical protein